MFFIFYTHVALPSKIFQGTSHQPLSRIRIFHQVEIIDQIHYNRFTSISQNFCTSSISPVTDLVKQEMNRQTRLVPVSQSADALSQTCIISAELLSERFEFWMFRVSGARRSIQRQGGNPSTPTAQVLELLHFYLYSGTQYHHQRQFSTYYYIRKLHYSPR
jgi:hypothetical protein